MFAVLTLNCSDKRGIVADVTQFLYKVGGNVLDSQQHREELGNQFFMYVKFDIKDLTCTRKELQEDMSSIATKYDMQWKLSFSDNAKKMAIMVSKYDHCLYDILLRHKYGELNTEIALIISNHLDLENVAEHFGVPYFYIPRSRANKEEADQKALELFQSHQVDFVVMARYMQILTPTILNEYHHRIINVHHGFLPAFKGAKPYHQAYEKGVKLIGASSHYATEELDMGPLIEQETARVDHSYCVEDLVRLGRSIESKVLADAVKAHSEDRIIVFNNRTIVFS
ncbi:MAG: formyltetrahydrofolate deformylase [Lentisphaeraceae bacterium]|nr:formyltetrahydrofolate deformylase [Lentisphaeraceae bacterium]